jgi:hypothetical protein
VRLTPSRGAAELWLVLAEGARSSPVQPTPMSTSPAPETGASERPIVTVNDAPLDTSVPREAYAVPLTRRAPLTLTGPVAYVLWRGLRP